MLETIPRNQRNEAGRSAVGTMKEKRANSSLGTTKRKRADERKNPCVTSEPFVQSVHTRGASRYNKETGTF